MIYIELAKDAKRKPNMFVALLLAAMFMILGSMFGIMGEFIQLPDYLKMSLFDLSIGFGGIILLIFLYVKLVERRSIGSLGFERELFFKRYLRGFIYGVLLFTIILLLSALMGGYKLSFALSSVQPNAILFILFGFLIQGAAEEILCRGWLMQIIGIKYTPVVGVLVSSLFFTLFHGMNDGITILPLVNLTLFALFAAAYTIREKSLWGICGFHSSWNWVQGSIYGIKVSGATVPGGSVLVSASVEGKELISGGHFGLEGSIVASIIFVIAILVILKRGIK